MKNTIFMQSANFPNEIKALRLSKDMTQTSFAELLTVDVSSVQNWENGRSFPRDIFCQKIIDAFSLSEEQWGRLFIKMDKLESTNNAPKLIEEASIADENSEDLPAPFEEAAIAEENSEKSPAPFEEAEISTEAGKTDLEQKPQSHTLKEKLKELRLPFVIGIFVWLAVWIILVMVCAIGYLVTKAPSTHAEMSFYRIYTIINFDELIIELIISFLAITVLSVLIYLIKRKIKK